MRYAWNPLSTATNQNPMNVNTMMTIAAGAFPRARMTRPLLPSSSSSCFSLICHAQTKMT